LGDCRHLLGGSLEIAIRSRLHVLGDRGFEFRHLSSVLGEFRLDGLQLPALIRLKVVHESGSRNRIRVGLFVRI
jgi:hypothetical protein